MTEPSDNFTETEYRIAAAAAPSTLTADEPSFARILSILGLFAAVLGIAAVVANQYGPRMITTGMGVILAAFGFGFLLFHAFRDTDVDIRRMYGMAGGALVLVAIVISLIPGRPDDQAPRVLGYYFLPWGAALGFAGLLFLIAFTRAETDDVLRNAGINGLLALGAGLTIGPIIAGAVWRETLLGVGPILALLGLTALGGVFARTDLNVGKGRTAAVGLGVVGAFVVATALAYSMFPTILHDGPAALKRPNQTYDAWKVIGRVAMILFCLGGAAAAWKCVSWHPWLRGGLLVVSLAAVAMFLLACFEAPFAPVPKPFLVPHGIILAALGLLYLGVSLGAVSDNSFVVLTRRELASYFLSPIGYIVLGAMTFVGGIGYSIFRGLLIGDDSRGTGFIEPVLEPILANFVPGTVIGPLVVPVLVAALTMRLFSEEKRSGTLDVLLTAPVSDATVIAGKFFACWLFFLICWLPPCLMLLGFRIDNGEPFDFRPLLTFFLAVGLSGVAFVAIGMFFSSLTRNQIVAAFLTFMVLMLLMAAVWNRLIPGVNPSIKLVLDRIAYMRLWQSALTGQLMVKDGVLYLTVGAFFLFLTAKSLEARKWT